MTRHLMRSFQRLTLSLSRNKDGTLQGRGACYIVVEIFKEHKGGKSSKIKFEIWRLDPLGMY